MNDGDYINTYEGYSENVLKYRDLAQKYLDRLNACIAEKTSNSIVEYMNIVNEPDVKTHCITAMQEISYAVIFSIIIMEEMKKRSAVSFVMNGNSMQDLIKVFKELEFCLWELEFAGGNEAEERLYDAICRYNITTEALYCVIAFASKRKKDILSKSAEIYLKHGREDDARAMLGV